MSDIFERLPSLNLQIFQKAALKGVHFYCRVKCFYQGCLYGFSFAPQVLTSRIRLADALKAAHAADDICSAEELQIVALDGEVRSLGLLLYARVERRLLRHDFEA